MEGSYGPYAFFLVKHTPEETRNRIEAFADKIVAALQEPNR
jgi:hypothetical protein